MGLVGREHVQLDEVNAAPIPGVVQAVFRHMLDQSALQSLGVALFELLLKAEPEPFSALWRPVVVSPTFEHGIFQTAVGTVQSKVGQEIISLFVDLWHKGHTIVLITHDKSVADRTGRIVRLQDGLVLDSVTL